MTRGVLVLLCLMLGAGVAVRLSYPASYADWIDRDIQRTIGLVSGESVPLVGPELNTGGNLPGPFFYVLLASVYAFTRSPYAAVYLNAALNLASLVGFVLILLKRQSPFAVIVSAALLTFSSMHVAYFGSPINPSFLFILNTAMVWLVLRIFVDRKDAYLLAAGALVAAGTQIHLSFAAHALGLAVLSLLVFRPRLKIVALSLLVAAAVFLPYAVHLYVTSGLELHRTYQQFSPAPVWAWLFPRFTSIRIFGLPALAQIAGPHRMVDPATAPVLLVSAISRYLILTRRLELALLSASVAIGLWRLVVWGYRSRFRFPPQEARLLVPFLAAFPAVVLWEAAGISTHPHEWYGFVFLPVVPWWIGASVAEVAEWLSHRWRRMFQMIVVASLMLLAPKTLLFPASNFARLDEIVRDLADVRRHLRLSTQRFVGDVFFLDVAPTIHPKDAEEPFQPGIPHGVYTDYLYAYVSAKAGVLGDSPRTDRCYLIGHRSMVEFFSMEHYLQNIASQLRVWVDVRDVANSEWLVYFPYRRPADGNCLHNTTNAWVVNGRLNYEIAKMPRDRQTAILADRVWSESSGTMIRRELKVAVLDRAAHLPMLLCIIFERTAEGPAWRVTLESAHLMGALNYTDAYAGLFRPWPRMTLHDVELVLDADGASHVLHLAGELGKYRYTPILVASALPTSSWNTRRLTLSLRYRTVVSGRYAGVAPMSGTVVQRTEATRSWDTVHVLLARDGLGPAPSMERM